ncbi:tetratricopeptide repeat protein [Acidiferrobacter sp.]|uniref:YfgM family protein n=1 Tax=Acidiferrobacter sp. TaxID=1872107 RepID=UPI00261AB304|nr:tetratricopeptide repeat protein [Acidiferrobacter sp.]
MANDWAHDELGEIKEFWGKYGRVLVYGVIIAALAVGGFFYYRHYEAQQRVLAGALYEEVLNAASQGRFGLATAAAKKLEKSYAATPYAGQGALLLAHFAYEKNEIPAAVAALKFAAHKGRQWSVRTTARLRLAGLLLALGHPHKAWAYAHITRPYGFRSLALGLQAEILAREGHKRQALAAYAKALKGAPKKSALTTLWRREQAQLQAAS